jgi:hypothetical protein
MTGISFVPVMVVLIIVIRTKKIINRFINSGTVTPGSAKTLYELNIRNSLILNKLVRRNVIVEISPERFYLHGDNLEKYYSARRTRILIIIGILILLILIDGFFLSFNLF